MRMKESEEELLHQNNREQHQDLGVMAHKSKQPPLMTQMLRLSELRAICATVGGRGT
jgi:hypothetical protein